MSERGKLFAAVLACGDAAALSHESAAAVWRIVETGADEIHVSVPAGRHPRHPGIQVHRRRHMPPTTDVDGISLVTPLFTLIDLARPRSCSPQMLEVYANTADRLGLISIDDAVDTLTHMRRGPGVAKLHRALTVHLVTDSDLERRFLRLVADAGLPRPATQQVVCGFRVDFYWPQVKLVVETDGLTYHRTPSQQAKDRVRDQALTAAGLTCLRFTNAQVRRNPAVVARTLHRVITRLSGGVGRLAA